MAEDPKTQAPAAPAEGAQNPAPAAPAAPADAKKAKKGGNPLKAFMAGRTPAEKAKMKWTGLVIAIEPMLCEGKYETKTRSDRWTVVTADGKLSAHFEHTIAVSKDGHQILTLP